MIIISNNLVGKMPIDDNTILRINLAWIKSVEEARNILDNADHDIYLDYPQGRNKPPKPTIKLEDALKLARHHKVKYFAVSNIEEVKDIESISKNLKSTIFVPKIETKTGVKNLPKMIEAGIKIIMLDKEDLYTDVNCDSDKFNELVEETRGYKDRLSILELNGVIFK